ncbi:MAG: spermidine synthase [Bacteroidia bacterium]
MFGSPYDFAMLAAPKEIKKAPFWKRLLSYAWPLVLERRKGELGHELEVLVYHGRLHLDTREVNYSFGDLHTVMKTGLDRLKLAPSDMESVLILGYGGGSVAQLLHQRFSGDMAIVGVEKDPVVLELCHKWFYPYGVKLVQSDAGEYLAKAVEQQWKYTLIVSDVFIDADGPGWSAAEWLQLARILAPGGRILFNSMMDGKALNQQAQWALEAGLESQTLPVGERNSLLLLRQKN